jgi:SAM-dependent methyltransferase
MLYGEPAPAENVRVNVGTEKDNAILTWAKVHQERKYLEDLLLDEDAFAGMKLLDIGSSAVPSALCFKDCDVFCLEPLLPELLKIGYPFWYYDKRARFIYGFAEEMPFPDSFFDAIIAVNSLDHVDDFYRCSAEIRRVSKPDVKLRFHLHYHKATSTEPLELSDAIVAQAFSWCAGFHKVGAAKTKRGTQLDLASDEIFTVWSNF